MQSAEVMTRQCAELLREARGRTLTLIADLNAEQLIGQRSDIVNPLRWEVGYVAWFQEYWAPATSDCTTPYRAIVHAQRGVPPNV